MLGTASRANRITTRSAGLVRDLRLFVAFTRQMRPGERPRVEGPRHADIRPRSTLAAENAR